jgi:3-phosphoshikimate 1-carboxyvinyltransferase
MHERPQAALFCALRELGYQIDSANDKLPALIHGSGPRAGKCRVSIEESSQFASALLLCAKSGGWSVEVTGENAEESPYVAMTSKLIQAFPKFGGFQIEPDASSGSYFLACNIFGPRQGSLSTNIAVTHWPRTGWQMDEAYIALLALPAKVSRLTDLGDSIMTAIVTAPFFPMDSQFTDLGRLRLQECERVAALRTELTKCGAEVLEHNDTLTVFPSPKLHGAEIETYQDHRMAMCFAIVGLKVPGITIRNPSCVKKTFPNFFQKLATAPPEGLGATILDGTSRRPLSADNLFAE